jgi:3-hydroxyacyl-[acyl-carrier-protein] dehydratase
MNDVVTDLDSVGIAKVLKMLPHRYPFVMIDRVVDIRGNKSGIGIKNVTINEPQFQGHFPENPVFPGVLLIEGMAQTGGILCLTGLGETTARPVYFMTIDKAIPHVFTGEPAEHVVVQGRSQGRWPYGRRG